MSSTSNLRKRLDGLIQGAKQIKCSAETTLAWRSLQMGKAWLGKALGYQGNTSPYKPAASVGEIPPTADVANESILMDPYNHLANVNAMRDAIQSEIDSIGGVMPTEPKQAHCYQKSLDHLAEARMWYGFELQELREAERARLAEAEIDAKSAELAGAKWDGEKGVDYIIASDPFEPNGDQLDSDPLAIEAKPAKKKDKKKE